MLEKYTIWMKANPKLCDYGKCVEATEAMVRAFPELKRVRGHYYDIAWGERQHWWLIDEDRNIIDPTKEQFPTKGKGHYEPWIEGEEEPTGKCLDCSGYYYGDRYFCSDECEINYNAHQIGTI